MTVHEILTYPAPMLRQPCRPLSVEEIQFSDIQHLIDDMIETMYHHQGSVGLAAPQIGYPVRIFVMDASANGTRDQLKVVINPDITSQAKWKFCREGCLSFPDYLVTVKRAKKVQANWLDRFGAAVTDQELNDFEAIILQHETDHLDGILFIDRVRNLDTDLIRRSQE